MKKSLLALASIVLSIVTPAAQAESEAGCSSIICISSRFTEENRPQLLLEYAAKQMMLQTLKSEKAISDALASTISGVDKNSKTFKISTEAATIIAAAGGGVAAGEMTLVLSPWLTQLDDLTRNQVALKKNLTLLESLKGDAKVAAAEQIKTLKAQIVEANQRIIAHRTAKSSALAKMGRATNKAVRFTLVAGVSVLVITSTTDILSITLTDKTWSDLSSMIEFLEQESHRLEALLF